MILKTKLFKILTNVLRKGFKQKPKTFNIVKKISMQSFSIKLNCTKLYFIFNF